MQPSWVLPLGQFLLKIIKIYKVIIKLADDVMVNSLDFKKSFKKRFNIDTKCIYNPFDKIYVKEKLKKKT